MRPPPNLNGEQHNRYRSPHDKLREALQLHLKALDPLENFVCYLLKFRYPALDLSKGIEPIYLRFLLWTWFILLLPKMQ